MVVQAARYSTVRDWARLGSTDHFLRSSCGLSLRGYVRIGHPCYNLHMTDRGVAYQLWAAIEDERLSRGWSAVDTAKAIGVSRNTVRNLRTSVNKPEVATVHRIADWLGTDRTEAEVKAGLRAPTTESGASARDGILRDPRLTDAHRRVLLQVLDLIEDATRGQQSQAS